MPFFMNTSLQILYKCIITHKICLAALMLSMEYCAATMIQSCCLLITEISTRVSFQYSELKENKSPS